MNTQQPVKIFDTTLRDGQQCPGAGMSLAQNLEYAHLVAQAGIDVLEAGFPAASQLDFTIVQSIAKELAPKDDGPIITALCQLREEQFERTYAALAPALQYNKACLHTYLPVDPNLMAASLGDYANNKLQLIDDVYHYIKRTTEQGFIVEFSPEGYSRMGENFAFVTDLIRAAVTAGATIINCPDTIGGACSREGGNYFVNKMNQHAQIIADEFPDKEIIWSTHCHNDFGLALENSMNAVFKGPARQIEGCFNGIGERAGNVSLEQCIMYLKKFGCNNADDKQFITHINCQYIQKISDFVAEHMLPRQRHWPITGENAARHSSGGHTNAILKNPLAYQPYDPKEIGNNISFLFGPLSGSNLAKSIIEKHGYDCNQHDKTQIAQFIKNRYAERRKGITDEELLEAYLAFLDQAA